MKNVIVTGASSGLGLWTAKYWLVRNFFISHLHFECQHLMEVKRFQILMYIFTKTSEMKKLLVLAFVIFLVACAAYKPLTPSQSDADRASKSIPGITLADLNQGKAIFQKSCHKCHSLKKPFNKTPDEIEMALPKMAKRAKLDKQQEDLVLKYLLTMTSV